MSGEAVKFLLFEAYRRNELAKFDPVQADRPITDRWLGLGTKTAYKPMLAAGLMEWIHGEPAPHAMGWLKLTAAGAELLEANRDGLSKAHAQWMADNGNSYTARFQLAGGLR